MSQEDLYNRQETSKLEMPEPIASRNGTDYGAQGGIRENIHARMLAEVSSPTDSDIRSVEPQPGPAFAKASDGQAGAAGIEASALDSDAHGAPMTELKRERKRKNRRQSYLWRYVRVLKNKVASLTRQAGFMKRKGDLEEATKVKSMAAELSSEASDVQQEVLRYRNGVRFLKR